MPALKKELHGLEKRGTFTKKSRLVLKMKKDAEGNTISRKARLVAHGFKQRANIDFDETTSTVSRLENVHFRFRLGTTTMLFVHITAIRTRW